MSLLLAVTGGVAPPAAASIIGSFYDAEDWIEEEEESLAQFAPGLNDFVAAWHEAEDAEDDDDLWQPWYLDTPVAVLAEFAISGFWDVDDDEPDEVEAVFAQITDSIAAADDFIQSLFEIDEDLLDDDDFNQAFISDAPTPVTPPVAAVAKPGLGFVKGKKVLPDTIDHTVRIRAEQDELIELIVLLEREGLL